MALVLGPILEEDSLTELTVAEALLEREVVVDERSKFLSHGLDVDIIVVFASLIVARRVQLVPELLHLLASEPHSESRLQLDNDVNLPGRVGFAA